MKYKTCVKGKVACVRKQVVLMALFVAFCVKCKYVIGGSRSICYIYVQLHILILNMCCVAFVHVAFLIVKLFNICLKKKLINK